MQNLSQKVYRAFYVGTFFGSSAGFTAFTLCKAPPRTGSFLRAISVSARGPPTNRAGVLSTATTRPEST